MKERINILVEGGVVQSIMADNKNFKVTMFDLDNDPEVEEDWDEVTKNQCEIL